MSGGNGKLVFENYKKLVSMWGGSANIEPLSLEISSGEFDDEHQEFSTDLDAQEDNGKKMLTTTRMKVIVSQK